MGSSIRLLLYGDVNDGRVSKLQVIRARPMKVFYSLKYLPEKMTVMG